MPDEWAEHVGRWFELTEGQRDAGAPDDVERYFLFQTLVGAWPIAAERIEAYMEKALREAKRNTNWVEPNTDWEEAVKRFCRALYADDAFLADFEPFARRVAAVGERAALGQLVAQAHRPRHPRHLPGRRARVPGARRPRQPPAGRLRLAPGDAAPADGRRSAGRRDPEAVRDDAAARAPRAPARAVRRLLRAGRRRPRDLRVRARRRGARRRRGAERARRGHGRGAARTVARRAARRGALVRVADPVQTIVGDLGIAVFERL